MKADQTSPKEANNMNPDQTSPKEANIMNPDQTAPLDLGSYCLQYKKLRGADDKSCDWWAKRQGI